MKSIFILTRNVHTNASNMCPCSSYVGRTLKSHPFIQLIFILLSLLMPFRTLLLLFFLCVFLYLQLIYLLLFYYSIPFFYYSPPFSLPICFIVSLDVHHSYFHPFPTSFIFMFFFFFCLTSIFPVVTCSLCFTVSVHSPHFLSV